jgi:uncharacterized membrane protein
MNVDAVARIIHVLAVVIWIGGVAMVTLVVLPSLGSFEPERRLMIFETIERRFAVIARLMVLLAGASGIYLVASLDLWDRFGAPAYWWMDAMVGLWAIFAVLLFVAEPFFLHRRFAQRMKEDPQGTTLTMQRFHIALLSLSLLVIAGAVAGAHGYLAQ